MIRQRIRLLLKVNVLCEKSNYRAIKRGSDKAKRFYRLVTFVVDDLCLVVEVFVGGYE